MGTSGHAASVDDGCRRGNQSRSDLPVGPRPTSNELVPFPSIGKIAAVVFSNGEVGRGNGRASGAKDIVRLQRESADRGILFGVGFRQDPG